MSILIKEILAHGSKFFSPYIGEIFTLLSEQNHSCISIKDHYSRYQYANSHFINLMGLTKPKQIYGMTDAILCRSKDYVNRYKYDDEYVIGKAEALAVKEPVMPTYNEQLTKEMQGKLFPIFFEKLKPYLIIGIFTPTSKLLYLSWDAVFKLSNHELKLLLNNKKYIISLPWGKTHLTKKEILLLIQIMKGRQAGEIANEFKLKQLTIESYISNIKNKLGVNRKSELIDLMVDNDFLRQIII